MRKLTTQEFIDRARAVHSNSYGYAFSVYQSAHEKVMIHCPKHGNFEQTPNNHFDGYTEWRLFNESIRHKLISFMDKELTHGLV